MCLFTRDKQPRVAKRDIVVLKYLNQCGHVYKSPCLNMPVTLGELIFAYPATPDINHYSTDHFNREMFSIKGGAIHAKLSEGYVFGNYCAKAIIPKGTEYWIDPFGTEIAAKQMLITKENGSNKSIDIQFFNEILESAPEKNGIRIGDYQMIDNSFVHPTKKICKIKVRGIVCGFYKDGSPIICALEAFREVWDTDCDSKIFRHTSLGNAIKLFNGKEVAVQYKKQIKGKDKERFNAFKICINYRKEKKEDWYFGSFSEIMTMLDNAVYLNAAHNITNLGFIININDLYWSCSEYSFECSWCCFLGHSRVHCCWHYKDYNGIVIPFYHMI